MQEDGDAVPVRTPCQGGGIAAIVEAETQYRAPLSRHADLLQSDGAGGAADCMIDQAKILIIDENAARAAIIEEGLREAGHLNVSWLSSTRNLLAQIVAIDPEIIVIDLGSPQPRRLGADVPGQQAGEAAGGDVRGSERQRRDPRRHAGRCFRLCGGWTEERAGQAHTGHVRRALRRLFGTAAKNSS